MPRDAKGVELKRGDEVSLKGFIEHAHEQLVTVRIVDPNGAAYEPSVTISSRMMDKLAPSGPGPQTEAEKE
jgi:hypothetical protein